MIVEWNMDVTKATKTPELCSPETRAPLSCKHLLGGITKGSIGGEYPEQSEVFLSFDVVAEAMRYDVLETPDSVRDFHLAQMHAQPYPDAPASRSA
jgi:hypothetical protein